MKVSKADSMGTGTLQLQEQQKKVWIWITPALAGPLLLLNWMYLQPTARFSEALENQCCIRCCNVSQNILTIKILVSNNHLIHSAILSHRVLIRGQYQHLPFN
jgi:hypothetical protein